MTYIAAKRKDGSSARSGDRALMIVKNKKMFGTIIEFYRSLRFMGDKKHLVQVYRVRCDDGLTRPAYQRHIKAVFPKKLGATQCLAA